MAGGWSRDGAVQEQIDASLDEAVERARQRLLRGDSARVCAECGLAIPEARRKAIPGVQLCIGCQSEIERDEVQSAGMNRRGSKGSQLR